MDKSALGFVSIALLILGYVPYFYSIIKKHTRPHVFTWLTWSFVNSIAFFGQLISGAGAGSWALGVSTFVCLGIAGLAMKFGEKRITKSDKMAFGGAVGAIALWLVTNNPFGSMLLLSGIDFLASYPTMRKSFADPYGENVFSWSVHTLRALIIVFAIEHYSPATLVFPMEALMSTTAIAVIVLWGRWSQSRSIPT